MRQARKISTVQLRALIREEAKRLREGPTAVDVGTEFGIAITPFIANHLDATASEIAEDFSARAPDDVAAPARFEDAEHFAAQAAEVVLNDTSFRESLTKNSSLESRRHIGWRPPNRDIRIPLLPSGGNGAT